MLHLSFSELSVIKLHKLFSCVTLKYKSHSFLAFFGLFVCFFPERRDFIIINKKIFHLKSLADRIVITKSHAMVKNKIF